MEIERYPKQKGNYYYYFGYKVYCYNYSKTSKMNTTWN